MKFIPSMVPILVCMTFTAFCQDLANESLKYLNQGPPGSVPKIFAPGWVTNKDELEFGSVFSKDGSEFFYGVTKDNKAEIRYMKLENNQWTTAEPLVHSKIYGYNDPFLSPDGTRLYFISDMPLDGKGAKKDIDIWYIERTEGEWTEPINAGKAINTEGYEFCPFVTKDGKYFFYTSKMDIYWVDAGIINEYK